MARNKFNIDEELDVPFNWEQFKRSFVYIKRYKKLVILMITFSVIASVLNLLTPKIQQTVIDKLIPQGDIKLIVILGVIFLAINRLNIFIGRARSKIRVNMYQ